MALVFDFRTHLKQSCVVGAIFKDFLWVWGSVLGGQNLRKIQNLGVFFGMLFETLFLVTFCLIFEKIDDEKHMEFCLFLNMLFYYLFAEFAVSLNARNLKNIDFPSRKCIFL